MNKYIAFCAALLFSTAGYSAEYCEVYYPQNTNQEINVLADNRISARVALGIKTSINPDIALSKVTRAARFMQAEFQRLGMDVEVDGFRIDTDCSGGFNGSCFEALRKLAPEHTHFHIWSGTAPGICGRASFGGTMAWTSIACGLETLFHEQGHNFHLGHSGEGDWQYGWRTWMGAGNGRAEYNAQNVKVMRHAIRAEGPGGYLLTSVYTPDYPQETHLVQIDNYFASLWRGQLAISRNEPKLSRSGSHTWLLSTIRRGEMVRVGGHNFTFADAHRGAASITVGDAKPAIDWSAPEEGKGVPISGLWSSENTSHQGMVIFTVGQTIYGYWMTWIKEDPRWYILIGTAKNVKIYRTSADQSGVNLIDAGEGQFRVGEKLVFDYWLDEIVRGRLELSLIAQDFAHPLSGHYGLGNMTGLIMQATPDGFFGYWLKHDVSFAVGARPPQQKWLMVVGQEDGLRIYEPLYGHHGVKVNSKLVPWGDARFDGETFIWSGREMGRAKAIKLL